MHSQLLSVCLRISSMWHSHILFSSAHHLKTDFSDLLSSAVVGTPPGISCHQLCRALSICSVWSLHYCLSTYTVVAVVVVVALDMIAHVKEQSYEDPQMHWAPWIMRLICVKLRKNPTFLKYKQYITQTSQKESWGRQQVKREWLVFTQLKE